MDLTKQLVQNVYKIFFSSLFIISLISCSPKTGPKIGVPEATKIKIIQEVESYLKKNNRSLYVGKGYAKVKIKIKSKRENFDAVLIVDLISKSPHPPFNKGGQGGISNRFRFETLDDLGNTKYLIVSDGINLSWKDLSKEEWETTSLSEKNLSKFLPLANSIEETLGLLIGRMPKINLDSASVFKIQNSPSPDQGEGLGERSKLFFSEGELIWNNKTKVIEFLALKNKNGKLIFEFHGKEFRQWIIRPRKDTRIAVPSQFKLIDLKTKNEIEINYKILEVGTDLSLSPTLFEIEP